MDYPSMREMTIEEYKDYIEDDLFLLHLKDILVLTETLQPIACTKEQIDALIEYLQKQRSSIPYEKDCSIRGSAKLK